MVLADDFTCGTCLKQFPSGWRARHKHWAALGHSRPAFECDVCPRYWECCLCYREFGTQRALDQHLASPARKYSQTT